MKGSKPPKFDKVAQPKPSSTKKEGVLASTKGNSTAMKGSKGKC